MVNQSLQCHYLALNIKIISIYTINNPL